MHGSAEGVFGFGGGAECVGEGSESGESRRESSPCSDEAVLDEEHLEVAVVDADGHDCSEGVEHDGLDFCGVCEVGDEHVLDEHRAACRSRRDYASFAIGSQIESIERRLQ